MGAPTKKSSVSYKDTLNLPRTDFPIRPQPQVEDAALLKRWQEEKIYEQTFVAHEGNEKFILHDGPPYANGHVHLGGAYNKILKDIVCKAQRMFGKQVPVTPGWDCHGLPIEINVTKQHPNLSRIALKKECRAYAQKWVDIQRAEFEKIGVFMNFPEPYLTMNPYYEAATVRAFGVCFKEGYIQHKNKTVPWCPSCKTVLAAAEIEYKERKDPSTYILFPLQDQTINTLLPNLAGKPISFLIWTTTPWTLPLNRAVLLKTDAQYVVLQINGQYVIVAEALADKVSSLLGLEKKIVAQVSAESFETHRVKHPFVEGLTVPVILDSNISLEDGTACVHCAPGCGPEDYEVAVKNELEIFSPISSDGMYQEGIDPAELIGVSVADGQGWVLKTLKDKEKLLHKTSIRHNYPHCWRCRNPLIFRATKQWFLNLSHDKLKEKSLSAIDNVTFIPSRSKAFLTATVQGRWEWCLSRQRVWGVPIPAVLCQQCDYAFTSPTFIEQVAEGIATHGIEYWDEVALKDILPTDVTCEQCFGSSFKKEQDILDVWFDAGVSHYAVLYGNNKLKYPADMYLEGVDQHRGWFQSSLFMSLILEQKPSMRSIVTHGFTVDAKGHKMSKSLGNVVTPDEIAHRLGTDGLRLWASSIELGGDAAVSDVLLRNIAEVYRKIRNTARFLLSNLYDFDIEKDGLTLHELFFIDKFALEQLFHVNLNVKRAYEEVDLTLVFHKLADYCSKNLSSFYLDVVKDRLYVYAAQSKGRRSAQTVCWYILDTLTKLIAPILSFSAEHISDFYQKSKTSSIHLQQFNQLTDVWHMMAKQAALPPEFINWYPYKSSLREVSQTMRAQAMHKQREQQWQWLFALRTCILKQLEHLREQNIIKHSLDSQLKVFFDLKADDALLYQEICEALHESGQEMADFLKELFILSQCTITEDKQGLQELNDAPGVYVTVCKAEGEKCPRCWQWHTYVHEKSLCQRCAGIVQS